MILITISTAYYKMLKRTILNLLRIDLKYSKSQYITKKVFTLKTK
jgi:hypothetical protein